VSDRRNGVVEVSRQQTLPLRSTDHIVLVRQEVRQWTQRLGFSVLEQTKLVTATSEIARNTLTHGRGGEVRLEQLETGQRVGLRLTFSDEGPGIRDLERALQDGYSTGGGLGLGLGGARRLVSEFSIDSDAGRGTRVSLTRWK